MTKLLDEINFPADLKRVPQARLPELCAEIRDLIISTVSETGGHLASSLGAVELTVALHYVFNTPDDRIIWDVGHQAYAHKILTGRKGRFHTLRQLDGISGFPKPSESAFDAFGAGHSSTSISAALGMAAGRDLAGKSFRVAAVIGDGSMTAGLAFEGLNSAGHLKKDVIVILNDNEMSISKNVGALSTFLSRKLTGRLALKLKVEAETFIKSMPVVGDRLLGIAKKAEDSLITLFTPGMLFEGLGFNYVGPIDGHDTDALIKTLEDIREIKGPVLVHALTKKGKGYRPAEEDPSSFHGVGPFDIKTGNAKKPAKRSYTNVFSSALVEIAEKDRRVVAITAAMPEGTGLDYFARMFPDRFFDVGIAEQHAITFAAGLSKEGFIPITAVYSTFLQRAYDQVFHDVCLQDLPMIIALDRAGIVGQDGATHHGLFDISYLRHLPNVILAAPKDAEELRHLLYSATNYGHVVAIRYPRGACNGVEIKDKLKAIESGVGETLKQGKDIAIIAIGTMVNPALEAARALEHSGIGASVINARFIKPLDARAILNAVSAARYGVVTVEENAVMGGFGSAVGEFLSGQGITCPIKMIGVPDEFIEHGGQDELRKRLGLDAEGIERVAAGLVNEGRKAVGAAS